MGVAALQTATKTTTKTVSSSVSKTRPFSSPIPDLSASNAPAAGGVRPFTTTPPGSRSTVLEDDNDENIKFRNDELKKLLDKGKAKEAETRLKNWRRRQNPSQQTLFYLIEESIKSKQRNHLWPAVRCMEELADYSTYRMQVRSHLTQQLKLAFEASEKDAKFKPHKRINLLAKRLNIKLFEAKKENTNQRSRNRNKNKK